MDQCGQRWQFCCKFEGIDITSRNLEKFKLFCSIRVRAVNTGISKRREYVYRKVNFGHNLMATMTCCMKNAVELAKNDIESALQRHFHDEILL